jgi:ATP-dependent protease HslVU (ClpYQ) peptidase subunit
MARFPSIHSTTILAVRQGGHARIAGDGQVTLGRTSIRT